MRATRTKIAQLSTARCSFRNGSFWSEARPHKGFRRRRGSATLRTETRGERRIGAKDAIYGRTLDNMSVPLWKHKKTGIRRQRSCRDCFAHHLQTLARGDRMGVASLSCPSSVSRFHERDALSLTCAPFCEFLGPRWPVLRALHNLGKRPL
jgi:hypothetical protein